MTESAAETVDADPQANSTSGLGVSKKDIKKTLYECMTDESLVIDDVLRTDIDYLELLPSGIDLVGAEVEMVDLENRDHRMKSCLSNIRDEYDFIIIDCSPSLGIVTVNSLVSSDSVIIPVQCEYFALEGLSQLLQTVRLVQRHLNKNLDIEGVLITMYDSRLNLCKQVEKEVREYFDGTTFKTMIRRNVRLSEAPSFGKPILLYDANSTGSQDYLTLVQEIINREIK